MQDEDHKEYKQLFIQSVRENIGTIEKNFSAVSQSADPIIQVKEIYRAAHSLKSSSTIMKQLDLAGTCEQILTILKPTANTYTTDSDKILNISIYLEKIKNILSSLERD